MLLFCSIVIGGILISYPSVHSNEDYCYTKEEYCSVTPDLWGETYPTCHGFRQSPINLPYNSFNLLNVDKKELHLSKSYSERQNFTVENTGHQLNLLPRQNYTLTGDLVGDACTFKLASFHWSRMSHPEIGSEHLINGKRYVMEAQFYHEQSNTGKTVAFALLFQISDFDNGALEPILESLEKVKFKDTVTEGSGLVLASLLKPKLSSLVDVIRYTGSHTIPDCLEGIEWFVFPAPQSISKAQLQRFQAVQNPDGQEMGGNIRPLQQIHRRKIDLCRVSITAEGGLLSETLDSINKNVQNKALNAA